MQRELLEVNAERCCVVSLRPSIAALTLDIADRRYQDVSHHDSIDVSPSVTSPDETHDAFFNVFAGKRLIRRNWMPWTVN